MEWRICKQNQDYAVSDSGKVKRIAPMKNGKTRKCLVPALKTGYCRVTLGGKYFYVHQLVARAFIGAPPTPYHEIAHFDGDTFNNRPSNLRWATSMENASDKRRHGTNGDGERNAMARLSDADVGRIHALRSSGVGRSQVASMFGVTDTYVSHITSGRKRKHFDPRAW